MREREREREAHTHTHSLNQKAVYMAKCYNEPIDDS